MPQPLNPLGGANESTRAAYVDLAFLADSLGAALRAMIGEDVGGPIGVRCQVFEDLGDDVAGALDADAVAGADAETRDLVGIVEGGVGDGDAADADRGEAGDGGQLAGAADLDVDRFER